MTPSAQPHGGRRSRQREQAPIDGASSAPRYHRCRVKIQFLNPPLGWHYDETERRRVYPRENGNIVFPRRYWRGMISSGINCLCEHLWQQFPSVMDEIKINDVRAYEPATRFIEDYGEVWEQLSPGYELAPIIIFPTAVWSIQGFTDFLNACGDIIGLSPLRSADGYGSFRVVDITPITF